MAFLALAFKRIEAAPGDFMLRIEGMAALAVVFPDAVVHHPRFMAFAAVALAFRGVQRRPLERGNRRTCAVPLMWLQMLHAVGDAHDVIFGERRQLRVGHFQQALLGLQQGSGGAAAVERSTARRSAASSAPSRPARSLI